MARGPLPIVVAVTGHTDIRPEDAGALTERVRALFDQLRSDYPHTGIELLTPLAEGADRLAARAAIAAGVPIVAVFPLDLDNYKQDFTAPASLAEFEELRAKAIRTIVLPEAAERPECYVRVGAYCVEHSHVLLALWDGADTHKPGGTSEIVRFALEGVPRRHAGPSRLLDPVETGIVHHVVAPRASAERPKDALTSRWLAPGGKKGDDARNLLAAVCAPTDEFNALALEPAAQARAGKSERDLIGGTVKQPDGIGPLVKAYGFADALALRFQGEAKRAILMLFVVGWLSILAFEAFTDLELDIFVVPYVLLFLLAYALYVWITSRGFDARHLDYRSLAEALRVQFYWRAAGIADSVAGHYMRYRIRESEWIRKALLAIDLRLPASTASNDVAGVTSDWVEAQNSFFKRAERRDDDLHHKLDRRAGVLMTLAMIGLLVLIGLSVREMLEQRAAEPAVPQASAIACPAGCEQEQHGHPEGDLHWLVVLVGVLAAAAGAIHGYAEKRALEAQAKRYARMHTVFQSALDLLGQQSAPPRDVLRELGREALEENADWVMLHRDRPLEPPGPGH